MKTTSIVSERMNSGDVVPGATAMTIDADSSVFMMDMLGKLYARPAQAALREYLSNAYDAHAAKGGELPPIQVNLPQIGDSNLVLSVRDFGNGMSEDEFKTILSRYGKSTKRDSNALIGGFGLGAKAGFALGNEFFMTSYQNGTGLRVRLFKDKKNQGYVETLESFETVEPDGMLVEVAVPRGNLHELSEQGLNYLLLSHDPKTLQVWPTLSETSLSLQDTDKFTPLELNGNIAGWLGGITVGAKQDTLFAVVGKVVYLLSLSELEKNSDDPDFKKFCDFSRKFLRFRVINLPIGSVDLPSSREEIILSDRSLKAITGACNTYQHLSYAAFQKEINEGSYQQAMLKVRILGDANYAQTDSLNWRGRKLGLALLKSSNAVLHHHSPYYDNHKIELDLETGQVSDMTGFSNFVNMSILYRNVTSTAVIPVDDSTDMAEILASLSIEGVNERLAELLKDAKRKEPVNYCFLFIPKSDPLYAMFEGDDTEKIHASQFNLLVNNLLEDNARKAMEQEEQRLQNVALEEARKAEMARMLTSFVPARDHRHYFPRQMTPEETFGMTDEKVYYWSQEEIQQLGIEDAEDYLFPFIYIEDKNTHKTSGKPELGFTNGYFHSLYSLISLLFPKDNQSFRSPNNRLIILGEHADLDTFKAEHPEVESGLLTLQSAIKLQTEEKGSDLAILFQLLAKDYRVNRGVAEVMDELSTELDAGQETNLNKKFLAQMQKIQQTNYVAEKQGYLDESYLGKVIISLFGCGIPPVEEVWREYVQLEETYPLLFAAEGHLHNDRTRNDIVDYINLKTK